MENKPMNHLCALRKTAVENVVPYITHCFLYEDSWEQFLSGFRVNNRISGAIGLCLSQGQCEQCSCQASLLLSVAMVLWALPVTHQKQQTYRNAGFFASDQLPSVIFLLSYVASLLIYAILLCFMFHCKPPEKHSVK